VGLPDRHKDGVTVAKEIELDDPSSNGRQMVREVARSPSDVAGGRHTTGPCWRGIFREDQERHRGRGPMAIKRGIDKPSRRGLGSW